MTDDDWSAQGPPSINRKYQYVWGVRHIDDLILRRQIFEGIAPWDDTRYAVTDHQFSTVALLDKAGKLIERVSYDAYGEARHHWVGDLNGDGAVDTTDRTLMLAAYEAEIFEQDYDADADVNRNGEVDSSDLPHAGSGAFTPALRKGQLSDEDNIIGYAGYVFNAEAGPAGIYTVRFRHYDPASSGGGGRWLERDPIGYVDGMSLYGYGRNNTLMYADPSGLRASAWGEITEGAKEWFSNTFWGGSGGKGLSRQAQIESAMGSVPIVNDPLQEFYDAQMEAEAWAAQTVQDIGDAAAEVGMQVLILYAAGPAGRAVGYLLYRLGRLVIGGVNGFIGGVNGLIGIAADGAVTVILVTTAGVIRVTYFAGKGLRYGIGHALAFALGYFEGRFSPMYMPPTFGPKVLGRYQRGIPRNLLPAYYSGYGKGFCDGSDSEAH